MKRRREQPEPPLYDVLFGDLPLERWPPLTAPADAEPWKSFVAAREHLSAGRRAEASAILHRIASTPELEPRHHLQAWHGLRSLGVQPDASMAKQVLGVVVEVPISGGLDVLAAYADRSARYVNHAGGVVIWERPDDRLDTFIDALLAAARAIAERIGPWDGPRRGRPGAGHARLDILTPSGLHFGEGPFQALAGDPLGGPAIAFATQLMKHLVELSRER